MSSATLNLNVLPRRMLKPAEAAGYCGRSLKRFQSECPVQPVEFDNGDKRYDIRDLDAWLDSLKSAHTDIEDDDIVARLA